MQKENEQNKKEIVAEKEILDLTKIINLKYASYLRDRYFTIDYCENPSEILSSLTLLNGDKTFFYQVETKVSKKEISSISSREALLVMLDYIDIYFSEYFKEEEDVFIPIDWYGVEFENLSFQMRGQVKNLHCEFLADELLKKGSLEQL